MADNFENNQNNQDNENNQSQLKEGAKQAGKSFGKNKARMIAMNIARFATPIIGVFLAIMIIVLAISSIIHELTLQDGEYREDDWTSIPYAASQYTSEIEVDEQGNLRTSMTAQEIWDKMIENNSRVDEFLDGPEDLLKLMNAEITTNYPDTRPNPDEPIDWDKINNDVNSDVTQGIIKFKRAQSDGSTSTMTYVDPQTFYAWIEQYTETGDESIRNSIMSSFTMEKDYSVSYGGANLDYSVNDLVTNISDAIVASAHNTPSPGAGWCEAWAEQVYRNAGLQVPYYATAYDAYKACVISTSMDNIPVGAAVFGTGSGSYAGHVGIYIGNGMVMDNIGNIATSTLEDWVSWQANNPTVLGENPGWLGWGWLCEEPTEIISGNDNSNDSNSEESTDEEQDSDTENSSDVVDKTDMQLIIGDGKVTFYNADGSPMEGGKDNALGYAIEEGQAAMSLSNFQQYKNSVIYIETSSYGEGSAANGKFVYITDNGPSVADNQIDVYANVDQTTLYAEPYGTYNGARIYMVEQNVTYEEYQSKYLNQTVESQGDSTQNGDNRTKYKVVVATWNETQEKVTSNDPNVEHVNQTTYSVRTQKINYQDMVSKYTMPFEYLWAFIVIGQGKEFSMDLAELVYGSQIEFTVYDNYTEITETETHNYTRNVTVTTDSGVRTEPRHFYRTHTTISRINTLNVSLTRANTWIVDYNQNYTYETPEDTPSQANTTDDGSGGTITTSGNTHRTNYVSSPAKIIEKTDPNSTEDNFITLFQKPANTGITSNIVSGAEWLFEILERNKNSIDTDLIDLTKYLLYIATGKDYGKTDFDFSIFDPANFVSIGGGQSNIGGIPGQIYDFLLSKGVPPIGAAAIVGNIEGESSFDPANVNEIGASGLCQWTPGSGRLQKLQAYANSKGTNWTDVQTQLEYMWSELESGYTSVKNVIMNATEESDLEYATWYFGRYYEIFFLGDSFEATKYNTAKRYEYAQKWYQSWQENHSEGVNVQLGEAARIQGTEARIEWLYDGNGLPESEAENNQYLETFPVEYLDANGNRQTMNITMHRKLKTEVQAIFKEMADYGFKIVGGDVSYRQWGFDAGFQGRFPQSAHTYGHAFDVNPDYNYCIYADGTVVGKLYSPGVNPYSVTDPIINIWKQHGFYWGGDWNSLKDYMHFSYFNH